MATDQLINKTQGDAIIAGLTAIKNAINDQPVPTQVEDVVSDAFDVGVSYVPGDYCIYENKLYKCDVAHHGAWDGNDFTLTNVGAELDTLNNALTYNTIPITTSTKYNDVISFITSSITNGKIPHIICEFTVGSNVHHNCIIPLIKTGYGSNNIIAFYGGTTTTDMSINIRTTGTDSDTGTFSNAKLYY